jgi:hypothetical protein
MDISILDPGQPPEIKGVTKYVLRVSLVGDAVLNVPYARFPAHEQISGASKIPTIIYYDKAGNVCAVGAEALTEGIFETAEEEEWIKAEWFVMPPSTMRLQILIAEAQVQDAYSTQERGFVAYHRPHPRTST